MSCHRTSQNAELAHTRKCSTSQYFFHSCSFTSQGRIGQMLPLQNYGSLCLFYLLRFCNQQMDASFYHRQLLSHLLFQRWSPRRRIRFSTQSWIGRRPQHPDPSSWFDSNTCASGACLNLEVWRHDSRRERSRSDSTHSTHWKRLTLADRPI